MKHVADGPVNPNRVPSRVVTAKEASDFLILFWPGEPWTLSELLGAGLTPWFWNDYSSGWDHAERYWSKIVFTDGGDHTLVLDGSNVLVRQFTSRRMWEVVTMEPELRVPVADLRFDWQEMEDLLETAERNGPIDLVQTRPAQVDHASSFAHVNHPSTVDYTMLATREDLIGAFKAFTGMNASWFANVTDTPGLLAARKVAGRGGRNHEPPLFCPFAVMQWLIDPKRRKGKKISSDMGWRLLEQHFPRVYNVHSVGDPRTAY
jgi:hypothetical protein